MQLINYPLSNHEHYGLAINVSLAYILITEWLRLRSG